MVSRVTYLIMMNNLVSSMYNFVRVGVAGNINVADNPTIYEGPSKERTRRDGTPIILCRCGVKSRKSLVPSGLDLEIGVVIWSVMTWYA